MTERELFDFVVYMDTVVAPEKEIDFEVDAPVKHRKYPLASLARSAKPCE